MIATRAPLKKSRKKRAALQFRPLFATTVRVFWRAETRTYLVDYYDFRLGEACCCSSAVCVFVYLLCFTVGGGGWGSESDLPEDVMALNCLVNLDLRDNGLNGE